MKLITLKPPQFFRSASKREEKKRKKKAHLSRSNPSSSFGSASEESEESAGSGRTPRSVLGRGVTRREVEAVLRRMAPEEEVAAMMEEAVREMLVGLGDDRCSLDDCRRMIGGVDTDGDGFVCFDDFVRMMTVAAKV
ncbi:probable calcium-binding protein CML36 [Ananas comosus]|uniref:Probable calcium-binding protein CML36 n=1 Tax=Ananas comosus TaxID=4615 RepID=A0A6P5H190_ANACO|nr:probable calcium-binding protein CML36 [Ananas comosus]